MRTPTAILIAGPTASGKSALALELAEKLGGVIVNADSMQVYRDLRIITARPTPEEEARAPHRLYGHVDAAENYSVGRWCIDARAALAEAERAGRMAIVVGGTGLYFKALTQGLAAVPPIPAEIRAAVRARLAAEGPVALHNELARRDPLMAARVKPGDRTRIARALEVFETTGRSLADWHREGMPAILEPERAVKIFLAPERDELHRRIDARFDAMLRRRRARRGARARCARPRSAAAGDEGAWGAVAAAAFARGDHARRSRGGRQAGHKALHQAAAHLVSPPDAGVDLDRAGRPRGGGI